MLPRLQADQLGDEQTGGSLGRKDLFPLWPLCERTAPLMSVWKTSRGSISSNVWNRINENILGFGNHIFYWIGATKDLTT